MTSRQSASISRVRWARVAGLLVVCAAIVAALGHQPPAASAPTAPHATPAGAPAVVTGTDPGVANLDRDLRRALRRASADAAADGIAILVDSGRRSPEHQQQLLDEAVARYGSAEEAARWVAPPGRSAHVSGDAIDVGPADAIAWLAAHGTRYGLCQIYANEAWHYELRPEAADQGCPPMYADPTQDPRLRR